MLWIWSSSGGNTLAHRVQCPFLRLFITWWIKKGQYKSLQFMFSTWNSLGSDKFSCRDSGINHWDLVGHVIALCRFTFSPFAYVCASCVLQLAEYKKGVNTTWLCHPPTPTPHPPPHPHPPTPHPTPPHPPTPTPHPPGYLKTAISPTYCQVYCH